MESAAAAAPAVAQEDSVSSPNTNDERSLSAIITPFNHSSLIGRRIAKTFPDGITYEGKITRFHTSVGWGISYDDGDYEDMNREELEMALKLYEERQNGGGRSKTTAHAAAIGTPSSSPTTASTSSKPKSKKRSKDTPEDEASQMLSDAKVSEDNAKRLLNTRTKKRKEIQKQVKDIKQEVANAKKLLEEAQQRLADESKKLQDAKSKENTAKKTLSMATKNREDIEGEIKPTTMKPKSLFKEDDVAGNLKEGGEDTDDDDKKMKGEDTEDDDDNKKMAAAVVTPAKKKRRKMVKVKSAPLRDEEKKVIETKIGDRYLIKFEVSVYVHKL